MKLTPRDIAFIELLVPDATYARVLRRRLESRSELLTGLRSSALRAFARNAALLALIGGEQLLAFLWRRSQKPRGLIFYDSNAPSLSERLAFLAYHLPGQPSEPVSFRSRMWVFPNPADLARVLRYLALYVAWALFRPSTLSRSYGRIVRACLLIHSYLAASDRNEVFLFQIHRDEIAFAAAYLRSRGYFVNLIASTTPLTPHNRNVVGSRLILCNPYQQDEFAFYQAESACPEAVLWSPEEIHRLAPFYASRPAPDHPEALGLYTQGYWLRTQLNKVGAQLGSLLAGQEESLLELLLAYLGQNPAVRLTLFLHPLERRHLAQTGYHPYGQLAERPQVTIDADDRSSIYTFDKVGLGLTTVSTVGFDRIFLGFRTLFYVPDYSFMNLEIPSAFNTLYIRGKEALLPAVETYRRMSHVAFMERVFGCVFWEPDR